MTNLFFNEIRQRMKKLWELQESDQEKIISIMLGSHGEVIGRFESPYSWIFTIKSRYGSDYLIAKAPKIRGDMTSEEVKTRLLKMLTEINTIGRICLHSFIHRFGEVEIILGVPFLISIKRHMNLRDAIEEGPFSLVDTLATAIQVARGIEYIQSRGLVCHQDLKAENIFIDVISKKFQTNEGFPYSYQAYLADFDLVNTAVLFGQPYGSRPYQAPEQYDKNGSLRYDKIDVFALSVNIVEMLTGGIHPVGFRTTDAWPDSTIGNKWNREDPWKKWARNPTLSSEISLPLNVSFRSLIFDMMNSDYDRRPSISEVKVRLLEIFQELDINSYRTFVAYMELVDKGEEVNSSAGWPYMDELIAKINRLYET